MDQLIYRHTKLNIPVYAGTFKEAQREATYRAKYLAVYLHGSDHPDAIPFVRDVIGSSQVSTFLLDRCVFWACAANTGAGYRYVLESDVTTFPYFALGAKNRFIFDLQGYVTRDQFVYEMKYAIENSSGLIAKEVAFAYERDEREAMRNHQSSVLREAEDADAKREAEKARKDAEERTQRREAAIAKEKEELERKAALAEEKRRQREAEEAARIIEQKRQEASRQLPTEAPSDASANDVAQLRVNSLTGQVTNWRLYRRESVSTLFTIVKSQPDYDGTEIVLVAGFPPKPLPEDSTPIFEFPFLCPRSVVNVRRK